MNVNDLKLNLASTRVGYLCSPVKEESNKYFPSTPKRINSGDTIATSKKSRLYYCVNSSLLLESRKNKLFFLSPVQRELQRVPEYSEFTSLCI